MKKKNKFNKTINPSGVEPPLGWWKFRKIGQIGRTIWWDSYKINQNKRAQNAVIAAVLSLLPDPRQFSAASTWKCQKSIQSGLPFPIARSVYYRITTVSSCRKRVRSEHIKKNLTKDPVI